MESPLLDASSLSLDLNMSSPSGFIKREFGPYTTTDPAAPWSKQRSDHKDEMGAVVLEAELSRVTEENQKLTQMLSVMCENFWALQSQVRDLTGKTVDREYHQPTSSRKRKLEGSLISTPADNHTVPAADVGNGVNYSSQVESTSSEESACKKQCTTPKSKISKLYVRTDPSDSTLVVKDGYQWRKYGQKVTRDNPCPRAYFKCSFAPSCPVKKKVQRSAEDRTLLVATYDGEHNHPHPSQPNLMTNNSTASICHGGTSSTVPCSLSLGSASPTVTLDFTRRPRFVEETTTSEKSRQLEISTNARAAGGLSHQLLVEQMATSLVKDPNFASALAAAISGRILQPSLAGKW